MEEEHPPKHQRGKSPQSRQNQAIPVQIRASKASPVQARQAPAKHLFSSNPQQARLSVGGVTKTSITKMESDEEEDEWSEVSELQEIDPRQLQSHKDQNGNVDKRGFGTGKLSFLQTTSSQDIFSHTVHTFNDIKEICLLCPDQ